MYIFGTRVDFISERAAVERALSMRGGCIFTPNALMLDGAKGDGQLRKILNSSDLNLPDGVGVLLAARVIYKMKKTVRVSGVDFGMAIARAAAKRGEGIFLLGGGDGVADMAAKRLCRALDGLKISGVRDGFCGLFGAAEDIAGSGARYVFVCLGSPMQEKWIFENRDKCPNCVFIGMGGSIDVYAGRVRRAPRVFSRMGLEWAWRMIRQPRRIAKIPRLAAFTVSVFVARWSKNLAANRKNRKNIQN